MDILAKIFRRFESSCEFTESVTTNWKPEYKFSITIIFKGYEKSFTVVDLINKEHSNGFYSLTRGDNEVIDINQDIVDVIIGHPVEKI